MLENLLAEVPGYQESEGTGGGVAEEVQVADSLRDDVQPRAGAETLHLRAEDLSECHVLQVEEGSVGDGCTAQGGHMQRPAIRERKGIRHDIGRTWFKK
jgi:hypothetical protein